MTRKTNTRKGAAGKTATKAALAAAAGAVALTSEANAAETPQTDMVDVAQLNTVASVRRLDDGRLEITLKDGDVKVLEADSFVENSGRFLLTQEALANFVDGDAGLLLLAGAAVIGGVALLASGGDDGDNNVDVAPVLNVPTDGPDLLSGTPGDDVIDGQAGGDVINGLGGNDTLSGSAGNDTLRGDAGDDVLAGGSGTDRIEGGTGNDTNSFEGIGLGVTATVDANGTGTAEYGMVSETFTGIENLTGSDNDDVLVATGDAVNVLSGGAGDDILTGGLGNDTLIGGEGFDTADFSDVDVPVVINVDADGNGTATRETGFSVAVDSAPVVIAGALNPNLSGDFVTEAEAGNLYFNVHTNDFGGGEIRGQLDTIVSDETVDGVRTLTLSATLDAAQEPNDASDSLATGEGTVVITVAADGSVSYSSDLSITGLATSDLLPVAGFSAIHLHNAPAGVNGPVVLDVIQDAGGDTQGDTDVFEVEVVNAAVAEDATFVEAADAGNLYFNIHTSDFPGGEIRGQLDTVVSDETVDGVRTLVLSASLDAAQEPNGASDSLATGEGTVTITIAADGTATYSSTLSVDGISVDDLISVGPFSAIHLHNAPAGVNGGVLQDIIVDAGGTPTDFTAAVGDGDVFDETVEVDMLESIEEFILSDDNDTFIASGPAANVVFGGEGDDLIAGGGGTDVLDGGAGNDTNSFQGIGAGVIASLAAGTAAYGPVNETFVNFENLLGSSNDDSLTGDDLANTLTGAEGADELIGLGGDDILVADLDDTLVDGGEGVDTLDLSGATAGVRVDLDVNTPMPGPASQDGIVQVAGEDVFSVIDVENIIGTDFDDVLLGNNELNVIDGGAGNDAIHSFGGADIIDGGEGVDTLLLTATPVGTVVTLDATGSGTVLINGAEADVFSNFENVSGSNAGDDVLTGNSQDNVLNGNGGDDILTGAGGADTLNGGAGDDILAGGGGTDIIDGGEGIDTNSFEGIGLGVTATVNADGTGTADYGMVSETFTGIENLTGSDNDDVLVATGDAVNVLSGGAGDDILTGGLGNDTLIGGEGFDTADFSDVDVPVVINVDADGNGTATRETGFSVAVDAAPVVIAGALNPGLSGDFVTEAEAGNLYFNVHTNDFGGGEIRGQLDTIVSDETVDGVRTLTLSATLDAAQEPNDSSDSLATGEGTVVITVAADGSVSYSSDLSITGLATSDLLPVAGFSAIHLHNAPAGVNGPVVLDVIQDAGGDTQGLALSAGADTGDGNVFNEVVEVDILESIEQFIGPDGMLITPSATTMASASPAAVVESLSLDDDAMVDVVEPALTEISETVEDFDVSGFGTAFDQEEVVTISEGDLFEVA